jgi:four helix bundle protein
MTDSIIRDKSFAFALRIVKLNKYLRTKKKEHVMSAQLLRCGTAIGVQVRESEHAESRAEFVHKLTVALKEANESEYWIDLLHYAEYLDERSYKSIHDDLAEILKLLNLKLEAAKKHG